MYSNAATATATALQPASLLEMCDMATAMMANEEINDAVAATVQRRQQQQQQQQQNSPLVRKRKTIKWHTYVPVERPLGTRKYPLAL
jgi:hypothetical protein